MISKDEIYIGIFWFFLTILIVGFLVIGYNKKQIPQVENATRTTVSSNSIVLSQEEIGRHNTENDCWIVINNDVYDVTNYMNTHPGGTGQIIPYCGKDATNAFDTQGGQGSHSQQARIDLSTLILGKVGDTINKK